MKLSEWFAKIFLSKKTPPAAARMSPRGVRAMAHMLQHTHAKELTCDEVHSLLDQFVDLVIQGEDASHLMPLVEQHLDLCTECREEYEALLRVLQASPDQ